MKLTQQQNFLPKAISVLSNLLRSNMNTPPKNQMVPDSVRVGWNLTENRPI